MPLDRRRFLTQTSRFSAGAALGMTALAGRSLPAAEGRKASPNDTIVCALIGGGGRGNYLINLAAREEDVAVTTVCDANRRNLARTAAGVGKIQGRKVKQVGDFRHLLGEIAYRTGRALRFDPKAEQFPGDEEANVLLSKKHRAPWAFSS